MGQNASVQTWKNGPRKITVIIFEEEIKEEENNSRTIRDLKDGEIGYTVPWSIRSFEPGKYAITKSYSLWSQSGGTGILKIRRSGDVVLVDQTTLGDEKIFILPKRLYNAEAYFQANLIQFSTQNMDFE